MARRLNGKQRFAVKILRVRVARSSTTILSGALTRGQTRDVGYMSLNGRGSGFARVLRVSPSTVIHELKKGLNCNM